MSVPLLLHRMGLFDVRKHAGRRVAIRRQLVFD